MNELYATHRAEIQQRWEQALELSRFDACLVHSGTPRISFQDDYAYPFRANPNFLAWLPLTHHHDSALLIRPGERPLLFYYQPDDYWYQPPADPESWWADHFEIHRVTDTEGWRDGLMARINGLTLGLTDIAAIGDAPGLAAAFAPQRINPVDLSCALQLARTRKTPYEIACMAQASTRGARGHRAAEVAFRQGDSEFDIHQAYLEACRQVESELPYASIVGLNENGAVLHYQGREQAPPAESRSFLIDAGCTTHAYASDITRSYSAKDDDFAQLIQAMDVLQQSLAGQVRAGLDYRHLHLLAHLEIAGLLNAFGMINCSTEDAVECGLSSVFFPHGLGHFIGLQTHDVAGLIDNAGEDSPRPAGHPFLRLTRVLEPGNVLTIEPGLYFIESLLDAWRSECHASLINWAVIERFKPYGGVRVEDDVVVTDGAPHNLTRNAFVALQT